MKSVQFPYFNKNIELLSTSFLSSINILTTNEQNSEKKEQLNLYSNNEFALHWFALGNKSKSSVHTDHNA